MAAATPIRAWRRCRGPATWPRCSTQGHGSRSFFQLAAAALGQTHTADAAHTLTTARTLPFAAGDLFRLIADVDAYAAFLPHCTQSRVTRWRSGGEDATTSWPARADLTVGWGPLAQTYSSHVYCLPGRGIVEAVSGSRGRPTLTQDERAEIGLQERQEADEAKVAPNAAHSSKDDPFESLVTRWTVVPLASAGSQSHSQSQSQSQSQLQSQPLPPAAAAVSSWSRVELRIRFQFRNPLYQLAAAQVGDEMATKMIAAFEDRARAVLDSRQTKL